MSTVLALYSLPPLFICSLFVPVLLFSALLPIVSMMPFILPLSLSHNFFLFPSLVASQISSYSFSLSPLLPLTLCTHLSRSLPLSMEDANFDRSVANQAVTYLHNEEEWARLVLADDAAGERVHQLVTAHLLAIELLESFIFLDD